MKTSKKLLSLFLAVVLVITTCSVGFTAFAADGNKTDSNNAYWNDEMSADSAFKALNNVVDTYIPALLNIDSIKKALEEKLGMTVTDETSIADLIEGVSPMLMGVLPGGSSASKSDIIPNYEKASDYYYSYLDDPSAAMDFYSLYAFCRSNMNKNTELGKWCKDEFPKLQELLDQYDNALSKFNELRGTGSEQFEEMMGKILAAISEKYNLDEDEAYEKAATMFPDEFGELVIDGVKLSDYKSEAFDAFASGIANTMSILPDATMKMDSIKDILPILLENELYIIHFACESALGYANKGGAVITTEAIGGSKDEVLTLKNYKQVLKKYVSADTPAEEIENETSMILLSILFDSDTFDGSMNTSKYLFEISKTVLAESEIYSDLDKTIEDAKVTDEQLNALANYVQAQSTWFTADGAIIPNVANKEFLDYILKNQIFSAPIQSFIQRTFVADQIQFDRFLELAYSKNIEAMKNFVFSYDRIDKVLTANIQGLSMIEAAEKAIPNELLNSMFEINMTTGFNMGSPYLIAEKVLQFKKQIKPHITKKFVYSEHAVPGKFCVEVVNSQINDIVEQYLTPGNAAEGAIDIGAVVEDVLNTLLDSKIDLKVLVKDIWVNLHDKPVETLFNLLPPLTALLDELLVPMLFSGEGDSQNTFLYETVFGLLNNLLKLDKYTQEKGDTQIGIGALSFDLNKVLPSVLHWLLGDTDKAYEIAGHYTGDIYDNKVPVFTNIYVADKLLYGASLGESFQKLLTTKAGLDAKLAKGIDEAVTEIATFAVGAIDTYVAEHGNDARYDKLGQVANKGLNDIFTAIPQLIDQIGKDFIKKYNIDSDWTYCYAGKITDYTREINGTTYTQKQNSTIADFKALSEKNDPSLVLESFVDTIVGNWLNSLLDFMNDMLSDDNNGITAKLPLIQGLLNAFGGLGEKSVISDLLNGLFQLKRSDAASFALAKREKTGFVGFSSESGLFLISNIQFEENGKLKGLVPLILNLIKPDENSKADYKVNNAFKAVAPLLANSGKGKKSAAGTVYSELLSKENTKAAQELIDTLDKLLASLLANTSLNGFDWDSTDNILASLVSFASAYLGDKNTNDIVKLLNNYLYYISGENKATKATTGKIGTAPTKDGDVDDNKVYTAANLSNLVIQTYSLIENIIDYLFYNSTSGILKDRDPNMLIADALYGIISPDAVAVRMTDKYSSTAKVLQDKDHLNWNSFKVEIAAANSTTGKWSKNYLKFNFKNGNKDEFYEGLGESLNGIAAIVGALLTNTYIDQNKSGNLYSEVIYPVVNNLSKATNSQAKLLTPAEFNKATDAQKLMKGLVLPIGGIMNTFYGAPVSMLLNMVKGLAATLQDSYVTKIVNGALGAVNNVLNGLYDIVGYLSPTLKDVIKGMIKADNLIVDGNIKLTLPKKNIVVTLINKLLADNLGDMIKLPNINWTKLATAKSPAEVLLLVYGYLVDTVLNIPFLTQLIDSLSPELSKILKNLSAAQILKILNDVLSVTQSPTEVFWSFSEYASKIAKTFSYPRNITASEASKAVTQLDELVANVFPLLNGLGVTDIKGLSSLVNDKLYTNEILTTIATALYGALNKNATVANVMQIIGIDVTTNGIANILMDKSYGKTYSSAAKTLKKAKNWNSVKKLNWGFTNGSAKAQSGFVNGLAAIFRPFNDIVAILLAGTGEVDLGALNINAIIKDVAKELAMKGSTNLGSGEYGCKLGYELTKGGIFKLTIRSNVRTVNNKKNVTSVLEIDLDQISKDIDDLLKGKSIFFTTNGYESAVIPLLEAFMCDGVKTYKQYKSDYRKAKDNLLINVLNPVLNMVGDVCNKPFDTLTKILPNVAYFIDSNGLMQAISNLLAPITAKNGLLGVLKKDGIDVDKLITGIAGKSLGSIVSDLLGIKTKLNIQLTNLKTCNVQDIIVPLVNKILKDKKLNIKVPNIDFNFLASLGTIKTVSSKAKNDKGKYTRKIVDAEQGKVLITVFRYIANVLITDASALKSLICNIDAIKKNSTLKNILASVFNTIKVASKDDIVRAVFYFLTEDATNTFFDYTNFTYKDDYKFTFGNMDEDFCRKLAPMLDGLVGGLLEGGLAGLVEKNLYKDDLISGLATGLYSAIEGVKISDDIGSLTKLLAMTGIDFSTSNVASLLTNADYGKEYPDAANVIKKAGSWKNVKKESLKWGVTDRDSFMNALVAVLRPVYGVLDVLLNSASLNLFDLVKVPGSDGYTSTIVPLLEAFGVYNIKTQYQYREDIFEAYDNVLLDIINPLWDKVEDILNAPIETLADILPNLSLFFANDGLIQIVNNLLTPVSALLEALKPIVNVNDVLKAAGLDLNKLIAKSGLNLNIKLDLYDLPGTLSPIVGSDKVVGLLNQVLGIIKIKGAKLGIELPEIDWFQLASHGDVILDGTSQAATYGKRIYVKSDQDETLIAVLRYLITTINYKGNYDAICGLIGGLIGGDDGMSGTINEVLTLVKGEPDPVIESLVDLLQSLAG